MFNVLNLSLIYHFADEILLRISCTTNILFKLNVLVYHFAGQFQPEILFSIQILLLILDIFLKVFHSFCSDIFVKFFQFLVQITNYQQNFFRQFNPVGDLSSSFLFFSGRKMIKRNEEVRILAVGDLPIILLFLRVVRTNSHN